MWFFSALFFVSFEHRNGHIKTYPAQCFSHGSPLTLEAAVLNAFLGALPQGSGTRIVHKPAEKDHLPQKPFLRPFVCGRLAVGSLPTPLASCSSSSEPQSGQSCRSVTHSEQQNSHCLTGGKSSNRLVLGVCAINSAPTCVLLVPIL